MEGDTEITNSESIIDSRKVIARIAYLSTERDGLVTDLDVAKAAKGRGKQAIIEAAETALDEYYATDEGCELKALESLQEECEGYSEWKHGEALIKDSYFEDYARELADDIGAVKENDAWPNRCIDWEEAAAELQQDYTTVSFDGEYYWIRW